MYEISKDVLAPLLEGRPKIAEHLSEIVAQRQRELKRISEQDSQSSQSDQDADSGLATQLLGQIRRFFGLGM